MARQTQTIPTVEISVAATSEELAILSNAAQRRRMTLKDFLRQQLVAMTKTAARLERTTPAPSPAAPQLGPPLGGLGRENVLKPAFLP